VAVTTWHLPCHYYNVCGKQVSNKKKKYVVAVELLVICGITIIGYFHPVTH